MEDLLRSLPSLRQSEFSKAILQLVAEFVFVKVKETKFEVIDLAFVVKVNFFKQEAKVWQREVNAHLVHTHHKFTENEGSIKILVKAAEGVSEAAKLLEDSVVDMLEKLVHPVVLVGRLVKRLSF